MARSDRRADPDPSRAQTLRASSFFFGFEAGIQPKRRTHVMPSACPQKTGHRVSIRDRAKAQLGRLTIVGAESR